MELAVGQGAAPAEERAAQDARLTETYWGYVLRDDGHGARAGALGPAAARFLGLVMVLSAYGQWLLPETLFGGDALVAKSVLSFILAAVGAGIYWLASRGGTAEVQVDLRSRELRVVHRNGRGQSRLQSILPMSQIAGAYMVRAGTVADRAELYLRFRGQRAPLRIAAGTEAELLALHSRISRDLRPVAERIEQRLARTVAFRSCRSA